MDKPVRRVGVSLAVGLIRFYQVCLSPLKGRGCCRFIPTCSQYALVAYTRFGFFKGSWLTLRRLLKCHPFYHGCVYDPVPEKQEKTT